MKIILLMINSIDRVNIWVFSNVDKMSRYELQKLMKKWKLNDINSWHMDSIQNFFYLIY